MSAPANLRVHLVDGTWELFRHHFGQPPDSTGPAAVRGVLSSMIGMLEAGATHLGVATDHVVESFRNDMWPGYKTSAGMPPELLEQFPVLEEALDALGVIVWPMVELEADDALASAAAVAGADPAVERVLICTPDKDLGQCVEASRVVQVDRRRRAGNEAGDAGGRSGDGHGPAGRQSRAGNSAERDPASGGLVTDEDGVWAKFGVGPGSVPDWLALVGDSADGFPGLQGWGPRSAAAVLARYGHLESVPEAVGQWEVSLRGGARLAATLAGEKELALLFRDLATLRRRPELLPGVDDLRWSGPGPGFAKVAERLRARGLIGRAEALAQR